VEVEFDPGRDAFAVCFDAGRVNEDGIERAIRFLGFRPRRGRPEDLGTRERAILRGDVPEPVTGVLARARDEGRFVLLDFFADWCAPCKIVEAEILPHPRVREALEAYIVLIVDVDESPEVVKYFAVTAMPTLLALDADGNELRRFEGLPKPEDLAAQLTAAREPAPTREEGRPQP
jgi:thiol-disulfide isomerase/thioredoxin